MLYLSQLRKKKYLREKGGNVDYINLVTDIPFYNSDFEVLSKVGVNNILESVTIRE
jgi:hypothetical protein